MEGKFQVHLGLARTFVCFRQCFLSVQLLRLTLGSTGVLSGLVFQVPDLVGLRVIVKRPGKVMGTFWPQLLERRKPRSGKVHGRSR